MQPSRYQKPGNLSLLHQLLLSDQQERVSADTYKFVARQNLRQTKRRQTRHRDEGWVGRLLMSLAIQK